MVKVRSRGQHSEFNTIGDSKGDSAVKGERAEGTVR